MPFHGPHAPPDELPLQPVRPKLLTQTFLLVALATLAYFIADGILLPTVPLYVEGPLGGGSVAVGIVVGAFSISALLLRPWAGRLSDRRGRRLLMLAGASIFAFSVLGYHLADSIPAMIVMRAITGAGEALFFVGAASAISDLAPDERRGEALSFFSLALYARGGSDPRRRRHRWNELLPGVGDRSRHRGHRGASGPPGPRHAPLGESHSDPGSQSARAPGGDRTGDRVAHGPRRDVGVLRVRAALRDGARVGRIAPCLRHVLRRRHPDQELRGEDPGPHGSGQLLAGCPGLFCGRPSRRWGVEPGGRSISRDDRVRDRDRPGHTGAHVAGDRERTGFRAGLGHRDVHRVHRSRVRSPPGGPRHRCRRGRLWRNLPHGGRRRRCRAASAPCQKLVRANRSLSRARDLPNSPRGPVFCWLR